jgi:hypothetical protein
VGLQGNGWAGELYWGVVELWEQSIWVEEGCGVEFCVRVVTVHSGGVEV